MPEFHVGTIRHRGARHTPFRLGQFGSSGVPMIETCPECDSTDLYKRKPSVQGADHIDATYRCGDCLADFDHARTRPKRSSGALSGLAADLAAADPDAVSPPASED